MEPEPANDGKHNKLTEDLIVGLRTKNQAQVLEVLEVRDDAVKKAIVKKLPNDCIRPFLVALPDLMNPGGPITYNILRWINILLTIHYPVIVNMPDPNSVLTAISSLLEDKSSLDYFDRVLELRGKLELLDQMKKRTD